MSDKTLIQQVDELCKKHNIEHAKVDIVELVKKAYIRGVHSTWDILTDKKQSHE